MHRIDLHIAPDHPAFAGHFPGQPMVPGALLLAEVLEAVQTTPPLAAMIGPMSRIAAAKFSAPVRPGTQLCIMLWPVGARLRFEVRQGEQVAASGEFEAAAVPLGDEESS